MAKVGKNVVVTGFSGKLGNLIVFRNHGGKTVVSQAPRKGRTFTEAQKEHHRRFQEAVLYGKIATADADMKEAYKSSAKLGQNAFNVAVADFMNAPRIEEIDLSNYDGQPGSFISILAVDDFAVKEITVAIFDADGTAIESGNAAPIPGSIRWRYTATAVNPTLQDDKIIVRVSDTPGNITKEEHEVVG